MKYLFSYIPFKYKNIWLLLGAFLYWGFFGYCQNQPKADSLERIYNSGNFEENERFKLLIGLAVNHANPDQSLKYSEELLERAMAADSTMYVYKAHVQIGNALQSKGNLIKALENYFKGVDIVTKEKNDKEIAKLYISIAAVYASMGNNRSTIQYYRNGIEVLKALNDTFNYAIAIENLGDYYNLNMRKPDSALLYFKESGAIWEELNNKTGIAYNIGNSGLAYAQLGQKALAEEKLQEAIALLEELGDYYPICVFLTYMADFSADRNDWDSAFTYALRSLNLAKQYGLKEQIADAYLKLSELYEKTGYASASLNYYKNHIAFRDSVQNITAVQQMADMEVAQKQIEVDLLNQRRKTQQIITIATAIAMFFIFLLAAGLYRRNIYIKRTNQIIEFEKDRSESLLLNILPQKTAQELKEHGTVKASKFNSVTVLFTDFVAFTRHSEDLEPELLVESIGYYFSAFDDIIEKYGLEKIKTIGDSYMCAGGLPFEIKDHAHKMIQAAFEILEFVEEAKKNRKTDQMRFDIRIGVNTGPVVAGVVGSKKFSYDIWGDTVNVASRMEGMSEAGAINISENTYELIKDSFQCEYRGEIAVKNRGVMKMYFVRNAPANTSTSSATRNTTSA